MTIRLVVPLLVLVLTISSCASTPKSNTPSPDPDINALISVDTEPKPLNLNEIKTAIGYPTAAKEAGIEGKIVVRVLVNTNGKYLKHKIIKGVHPMLNNAVDAEVKNLKFTPALKDEKPIKAWTNLPFNFKLVH